MPALVGLGNPGASYRLTRHNIGQMVVERMVEQFGGEWETKAKFKGRIATLRRPYGMVRCLIPETYMNLSGEAVAPFCGFYGIAPTELLVVSDEIDIPFGHAKLKIGGGDNGHKGLISVGSMLGDKNFGRLRMGVSRPPGRTPARDYVLKPFTAREQEALIELLGRAVEVVETYLESGLTEAQNRFHGGALIDKL